MVKQQDPVKGADIRRIQFVVFGFYQLLYEFVHGGVLYTDDVVATRNVRRPAAPEVFLFRTRHIKAAESADDYVKVKIVQLVFVGVDFQNAGGGFYADFTQVFNKRKQDTGEGIAIGRIYDYFKLQRFAGFQITHFFVDKVVTGIVKQFDGALKVFPVGKGIVASEPFLSLFAGRGNQAVGVALAIVGGVSCRLYARTGDPELLTNKKGSILVEPFLLFPNIVPIRFFTSSHS